MVPQHTLGLQSQKITLSTIQTEANPSTRCRIFSSKMHGKSGLLLQAKFGVAALLATAVRGFLPCDRSLGQLKAKSADNAQLQNFQNHCTIYTYDNISVSN